ncbi:hypothetical protein [Micrococcus sp.]|uniref:hypothetical protein n=1 Tax=Micrococcus sp. TaxID=1271 RepID=UPI002A90E091|nr:hypothetical protein [Micrococcus sp.]MDY6054344.1 hypothetical protein [Micrococcus sp.]
MSKRIAVYDQLTGRKTFVPEFWLGRDHPQFSRFRRTPSRRKRAQNPAPEPVISEVDTDVVAASSHSDQERQ